MGLPPLDIAAAPPLLSVLMILPTMAAICWIGRPTRLDGPVVVALAVLGATAQAYLAVAQFSTWSSFAASVDNPLPYLVPGIHVALAGLWLTFAVMHRKRAVS